MKEYTFDREIDMAWCPGCGNFAIRKSVMDALKELEISPQNLVLTSGIGQAAKMPQYINTNYFNGLHGRALPLASAIKMCNPELKVIAFGGDGDMYGEGGNHFIHNIRRNIDITHIVHNNMVYGLTKGQASPTSQSGFVTGVQTDGVILEPFNPVAAAIILGATFVARAFSGDVEATKEIIKAAIMHEGYALVDIFQPCVSFNKINTAKWFRENTYYLGDDFNNTKISNALEKSLEKNKYPLGIIYKKEGMTTYTQKANIYENNSNPVICRKRDINKINALI